MKMLKVAKREYLERVKKKSFVIGTILGPLLMATMIVLPGLLFELSPETQEKIAVVDRTGGLFDDFEKALGDTLKDGSAMFLLRRVEVGGAGFDETKKQLGYEVESDALDGYLVIPEDVSEEGKAIFRSHAYVTDPGPLDKQGFCLDGGKASEEDCKWLVEAAKVCKDESLPVNVETCGHLLKEVIRQRKTKRAGVE